MGRSGSAASKNGRRMTLGSSSLAFGVAIFRRVYGCPLSWRWRKRRWDQNGHSGSTPTAFVSISSVFGRRSLAFEQDNFGRRCRVRGIGDRANFGWRTFRLSDGRSGEYYCWVIDDAFVSSVYGYNQIWLQWRDFDRGAKNGRVQFSWFFWLIE